MTIWYAIGAKSALVEGDVRDGKKQSVDRIIVSFSHHHPEYRRSDYHRLRGDGGNGGGDDEDDGRNNDKHDERKNERNDKKNHGESH